jgi:hypothetical protein
MKLTPQLLQALNLATKLHQGQLRKVDGLSYIVHPVAVAIILSEYTKDDDTLAAALLHDTLEDVPGYSYDDLVRDSNEEVARLVRQVSEGENNHTRGNWSERKLAYLNQIKTAPLGAVLISAADKLHNLRSLLDEYQISGEAVWRKFNSDPLAQKVYYDALMRVIKFRLQSGPYAGLYRELADMMIRAHEQFPDWQTRDRIESDNRPFPFRPGPYLELGEARPLCPRCYRRDMVEQMDNLSVMNVLFEPDHYYYCRRCDYNFRIKGEGI